MARAKEIAARRPLLAAAVLYGLLAFVLFAPGLAPGRTLSASDYLWSAAPWESSRPAEVPGLGSNRELVDEVVLFQPQLQYTRAAAARPAALGPARARAAGRGWPTRSRRCSRSSACPRTCCRSGSRWRWSRCSRCSWPRSGPSCWGGRWGCAPAARSSAGSRSGSGCGRCRGSRGRSAASGRCCPGSACSASCAFGGQARCRGSGWPRPPASAGWAATRRRASRCWWSSRSSSRCGHWCPRGCARGSASGCSRSVRAWSPARRWRR